MATSCFLREVRVKPNFCVSLLLFVLTKTSILLYLFFLSLSVYLSLIRSPSKSRMCHGDDDVFKR